ncbi:MAG: ABC transporter permease subunit [Elusimicrobiota bacterium]
MKNKFFPGVGFFVLLAAIVIFLLAMAGIVYQLFVSSPQRAFNLDRIIFAVKLSLITSGTAAFLSILLAIPSGYVLSRYNFFGKKIVEAVLLLPMVISPTAMGAILLIFFNTPAGKLIEKIFGPIVFNVRGIVLAQVVIVFGLAVTLVKTVFDYTEKEYEDIARTLGATENQMFLRISLPMAKKGILVAIILVWARALGEFGATVTLAGATTFKTETLPVAIFLSLASADVHLTIIYIILSLAMAGAILFLLKVSTERRH